MLLLLSYSLFIFLLTFKKKGGCRKTDNRRALCASLCCIVTAESPNNDGLFSSDLKIEINNNLNKSNVYEYEWYMTDQPIIYRMFFAIVIVILGGD